jgi:uncharacterized protein (DUF4213/DUF364 family)
VTADESPTGQSLLAAVTEHVGERGAFSTDPRLTVGERVLLVEFDHPEHGRLAGLAHRPDGDAARIEEESVTQLAGLATGTGTPVERAVGIATLNALSVPDIDWRTGDPMAALPEDADAVATVGLFKPAFGNFDDVHVRVVERDPPDSVETPPDVSVSIYSPGDCSAAFDGADGCFVTGSTLVYGGIGRYLSALSAAGIGPVVLIGATASHRPEPAFAAGVDIVAGARVSDVDRTRQRVAAGDCGPGLHDAGVEKVYAARSSERTAGSETRLDRGSPTG